MNFTELHPVPILKYSQIQPSSLPHSIITRVEIFITISDFSVFKVALELVTICAIISFYLIAIISFYLILGR